MLRFVQFILIPDGDGFHPTDQRIADHEDLTRQQLLNILRLGDGTVCSLYHLKGDVDAVCALLGTDERVHHFNLSKIGDSLFAYVRFESSPRLGTLLRIPREFDLIYDLPFEYTPRGGLRISIVGDFEALRESGAAVPGSFRMKLEETGQYRPGPQRIFAGLTTRQQETLRAAVEMGYYRNPRDATYKEIAKQLDRTDATVGEHLRNVEEQVMQQILP